MAHRTADEVARRSAPRASEHPGEGDEGKGEVGRGDGEQAKERDGRRGVPARPKVDGHVGERGGEKREIEKRGQALGSKMSVLGVWLVCERGGSRTRSMRDERKRSQK